MKRIICLLFAAMLFGQILTLFFVSDVEAAIETPEYGWELGKYDVDKNIFTPSNTSSFPWNGMTIRTIGKWSVNQNSTTNRVGSIISFVDKNNPKDNGYPMVAESQWDVWIDQFKGDKKFVRNALLQKKGTTYWEILANDGKTYNFANFSKLVELCGGRGVSYSIRDASSYYVSSKPPYATLLASETSVKAGEAVTFTIRGQSNTEYSKFIDLSFAGAGQTIWTDKRFPGPRVDTTYSYTFNTPGTYTFSIIVKDSVWRTAASKVTIAVGKDVIPPPPSQPPSDPPDEPIEDPNKEPVARFSWPTECFESDTVDVIENSYDRDGEIVDWRWRFTNTTGITHNLAKGGGQVTFQNPGTYELRLNVEDDDGATDSTTKSILVKPPIPAAKINYSGSLKENRKVVLDSSGSSSPSKFPINHSMDQWTITPVSGGSSSDIKYGQKTGSSQEVLFKKAGTYKVGLKVANSRYDSEWVYKEIIIAPDSPPTANFIVPTIVFREPLDLGYAIIKLTDKSYSIDDDVIIQRVWKYKFDSNNNGDFSDDPWIMLDSNNNMGPYLRVNHVGKYLFELEVKESFGQPTIPEFITDSDYLRDNTDDKSVDQKVVDVKNVAPVTFFSATVKPKADICFIKGDIAPEKISDLQVKIDSYVTPKMIGSNVDTKIIMADTKTLGTNIVQQPSFEVSTIADGSTPWGGNYRCYDHFSSEVVSLNSTVVRTGQKSVKLEHDGFTGGFSQKLTSGWTAGQKTYISAYINVPRYVQGYLTIDLYGRDKSGHILDSVIRKSYSGTTNGWMLLDLVGDIPAETGELYLRIFADGQPDATWYVDDVSVSTVSNTGPFSVNPAWRSGAQRYMVYLTDTTFDSTGSNTLTANGINFSVLGTDQNKAQALSIIAANSNKGSFQYNTNIAVALGNLGTYISNLAEQASGQMTDFIPVLLGEALSYDPVYTDYENDPKFAEAWYITHTPTYVDNNDGVSTYNNKTLSTPPSTFDKVGKYDIEYRARDNPAGGDTLFLNYFLWSDPAPTAIIVHRKPIASFTVQPGTLYITDTSYDPDFQYKRPDKGVVERFWQWKKTTDANWTVGKPTGITQPGNYYFYLRVKDNYGVWSDPYQMAITVTDLNRPPNADFNWSPALLFEADDVNLKNLSTDPDGDPLTYQWTIFDPMGVTKQYSTKDSFISNAFSGTYWVTLRVWDNRGGTDVVTKSFSVNELNVLGYVRHTEEWNTKRINFNRSVSGTDNSPRGYNVFWAGEKFVLMADTTDTASSQTKAVTVKVSMPALDIDTQLQGNADKTRWSGEMWDERMINLADGPYQFIFTAVYSNGAQKTCEVWVNIDGSIYDYHLFHRAE